MSQIITKGYLINQIDYSIFDEIITFINEYGNKFVCLAKGVKKISSKNARNLQLGNFCEFNFFLARDVNKVSKLVKVNVLKQIKWPIYRNSFFLLNNLANNLIYPAKKNFVFYHKWLNFTVNEKIDDQKVQLIILHEFCKISGIDLDTNHCVLCHSHQIKTITFKFKGLICQQCCQKNKIEIFPLEFTKLAYFLFKNKYDKLDEFSKHYSLLIEILSQYIKDNLGIDIFKKFYH